MTRFCNEGDADGQLRAVGGLAVGGKGRVYISDINGVQVFDSTGRFLERFYLDGHIFGLSFDPGDRLNSVSNTPPVMRLSCTCSSQ